MRVDESDPSNRRLCADRHRRLLTRRSLTCGLLLPCWLLSCRLRSALAACRPWRRLRFFARLFFDRSRGLLDIHWRRYLDFLHDIAVDHFRFAILLNRCGFDTFQIAAFRNCRLLDLRRFDRDVDRLTLDRFHDVALEE